MNENIKLGNYFEFLVEIDRFECTVVAQSYSSAKYKAFQELFSETYTYEEFLKCNVKIHINKIRNARLSSLFKDDETLNFYREYRNMPFLELGMKVMWCGKEVYIIGGSDKLYFYDFESNKIFIDHPKYRTKYFNENDRLEISYD